MKASDWRPIDAYTPHDRWILVFAPPVQDLSPLVTVCCWHPDFGFCVDELRVPTHWQPYEPPATQKSRSEHTGRVTRDIGYRRRRSRRGVPSRPRIRRDREPRSWTQSMPYCRNEIGAHMPTAYTACIEEGQVTSLARFAEVCAHAFGLYATSPEEPVTTPLPDKMKVDPYHLKEQVSAQAKLRDLLDMDYATRVEQCRREFEAEVTMRTKLNGENAATKILYEIMMKKVTAWAAPEHLQGLREFMLEQLRRGIVGVNFVHPPVDEIAVDEWFRRRVSRRAHEIEYHSRQYEQEQARVAKLNEVLAAIHAMDPDFGS